MTSVEIPGIKDAEFEATAAVDGGSLVMRLWGNADLRVNGPLGPFLDQVDDQARRNHMGEVVAEGVRPLDRPGRGARRALPHPLPQRPGRAVAVAQPAGPPRLRAEPGHDRDREGLAAGVCARSTDGRRSDPLAVPGLR